MKVDLRAIPYMLDDDGVRWVENTIAAMTDEEKVGQLFFQLTSSQQEDYLKELMEKYHLGGCRYNGMPGVKVAAQNRILQKYAKVPVFIACNTENGGAGACADGTYLGSGIKIAATDDVENARSLGRFANEEAAVIGCNMAFAPVADIHYNWENTEIVQRAFGQDVDRVTAMSRAYMEGAQSIEGFASVAKHFPGNGQDFRDAHLSNNVNSFGEEEWMATYGKVYREMFEHGLCGIMGGHIMMPTYMREVKPGITDDEMLPATLCPEIMTGLLRDKLGFNGMVVTDASHMVGMTDRMTRKAMLPAAINAGCDMFLFFNDPDEDFATMLNAYRSGIISEDRMQEALTRILGLKAHLGMHRKNAEELVPSDEKIAAVMGKQEYKDFAKKVADESITLVKYRDKDVLPLTTEKYKRIMIVEVKSADGPMAALMAMAMGGAGGRKTPGQQLCELLQAKGFDAFIYESPLDKMKKQIAEGKKPDLNVYFAGKNAIAEFTAGQDLVITLCNCSGRPAFGVSKGGGEIPWYVFEQPVVGISVNMPTMLADIPMLRTYINAYDSRPDTLAAIVEKLTTGPEAFTGTDPIDSFCGLWDTKL